MKILERPELFGNMPNGVPFQLDDGSIGTRENGCLMKGKFTYWTAECANNKYICYPLNWTRIMIHSYHKAVNKKGAARIGRIFWEMNLMDYRPKYLKSA